VALPTTRWEEYGSPTDRGIAEEAVRRLGLDAALVPAFAERFVADLERALRQRGAQAVAGATTVLDRLASAGHAIALATGAWERSARAKLAAAGIAIGERVLVGSDFDARREAILQEAMRRSAPATRTVYVGDGSWDVAAARTLGLPFVGVDAERTGALGQADVRHVLDDLEDLDTLIRALRDATVP
jgi:phosphoglycolate phosphatase-like HAD superfamily hydrolase